MYIFDSFKFYNLLTIFDPIKIPPGDPIDHLFFTHPPKFKRNPFINVIFVETLIFLVLPLKGALNTIMTMLQMKLLVLRVILILVIILTC